MKSYQTDTSMHTTAEAAVLDFGWISQGQGSSDIKDLSLLHRELEAARSRPRHHILVIWISVLLISTSAFLLAFRQASGSQTGEQEISSANVVNSTDDFKRASKDGASDLESDSLSAANKEVEVQSLIASFFTPEVRYWAPHIEKWAQQYELDPNIIATIMQIESCGNPHAVSHAGAQGLFQVMPFHFQPGEDMQDPDTNAKRGLAFIKKQMEFTGGDIFLSFAGYNGGYAASGGNYNSWPHETKRYFYWAKGIYSDGMAGADHSLRLDEWLAAGGQSLCIIAADNLGI